MAARDLRGLRVERRRPWCYQFRTGTGYWPKMSLPVVLAHWLLRLVSASVSTCTLRPSMLTSGSGGATPSEFGLIHNTSEIFCWYSGRSCMFRYTLAALG